MKFIDDISTESLGELIKTVRELPELIKNLNVNELKQVAALVVKIKEIAMVKQQVQDKAPTEHGHFDSLVGKTL